MTRPQEDFHRINALDSLLEQAAGRVVELHQSDLGVTTVCIGGTQIAEGFGLRDALDGLVEIQTSGSAQ